MKNSHIVNVPVVFIHFGSIPKYLIEAIKKAVSYGNKVYLLTDVEVHLENIEIVDVKTINTDEILFKSFYKHMSTNSYQFEYMCIYRWFILKNFMINYSVKKTLYLDSDVYLFDNTSNILLNYPEFEFAYNVPDFQNNYYWAGSACCSFWSDKSIVSFCEKIQSYYTTGNIKVLEEKWAFHNDNNIAGGICDMTFLYLFSSEFGFLNLGKVFNKCCFDFHNAISANYSENEYAFKQGNLFQIPTKDINFINGIPYCTNLKTRETVKFYALTEYAKLLEFSKKLSLVKRIKSKMYAIKQKIFK